jgi:hypothetical protein
MMTEQIKILVALAKFPLHPKAPNSPLWAGEQQSPASALVNLNCMLMLGFAVGNRASRHTLRTAWTNVVIATFKNKSDEPPRMIVKMPLIVGSEPMVKSNGE